MTKVITVVLILCLSFSMDGQIVEMTEFDNYIKPFSGNEANDDFEGSPYLFEDWRPVTVKIGAGKHNYSKGRYNIYHNRLEVFVKGEPVYIEPGFVSSFQMANDVFGEVSDYLCKSDMVIDGKKVSGLVRMTAISEGLLVITTYNSLRRKVSKANPHLTGVNHKDRIVIKRSNYIMKDGDYHQIKKDRDLSKLYPDQKSNIKKAIKQKDIDVKKHEGVVQVLKRIL